MPFVDEDDRPRVREAVAAGASAAGDGEDAPVGASVAEEEDVAVASVGGVSVDATFVDAISVEAISDEAASDEAAFGVALSEGAASAFFDPVFFDEVDSAEVPDFATGSAFDGVAEAVSTSAFLSDEGAVDPAFVSGAVVRGSAAWGVEVLDAAVFFGVVDFFDAAVFAFAPVTSWGVADFGAAVSTGVAVSAATAVFSTGSTAFTAAAALAVFGAADLAVFAADFPEAAVFLAVVLFGAVARVVDAPLLADFVVVFFFDITASGQWALRLFDAGRQ